jgi:2-oxo-4-hydroxy-4-carboxy-5-ureidoimidazoline decarboxylase
MTYPIDTLNPMPQPEFVAALGAIFERTPAIAAQAWLQRPFLDVNDLHQKMVAVMWAMPFPEKLLLIQAHPDLGSRAKMAEASMQEQAGAGLDRLTPEEFQHFQTLNQQYVERFGFPFIIAVKNHTKSSILQAFIQRLNHSPEVEMHQALTEIATIARFRLLSLIEP